MSDRWVLIKERYPYFALCRVRPRPALILMAIRRQDSIFGYSVSTRCLRGSERFVWNFPTVLLLTVSCSKLFQLMRARRIQGGNVCDTHLSSSLCTYQRPRTPQPSKEMLSRNLLVSARSVSSLYLSGIRCRPICEISPLCLSSKPISRLSTLVGPFHNPR